MAERLQTVKNDGGRFQRFWAWKITAIFIALGAIAVWAVVQWQRAEQKSQLALARQLVAQAQALVLAEDGTSETAMLLAVQSMSLNPSGEAAEILQNDQPVFRNSRTERDGYMSVVVFSRDGKYAAFASEKRKIYVWNALTGEEKVILPEGAGPIQALAFSSDDRYLVAGASSFEWRKRGLAQMWELAAGREILRWEHDFGVGAVAIRFDDKYMATGSYDGIVRIWSLVQGKSVGALEHVGAHTIAALAFSPDGHYLLSGTREDYAVRVWNISTGQEVFHTRDDDYVTAVAFSPDGRYVVAASDSRGHSLRIWELSTGREVSRINSTARVNSVAFSPDGKYLLSGGEDLTARVWDVFTGEEISRLRIANGSVIGVTFSADGKSALAGDNYETVHVWQWRPADLIADACLHLGRNLTRAEWQQYLGRELSYQAVCPNLPVEISPAPVIVIQPTLYLTSSSR